MRLESSKQQPVSSIRTFGFLIKKFDQAFLPVAMALEMRFFEWVASTYLTTVRPGVRFWQQEP
jgi:hypothetical protein